jgi:hypothetical protein
MGKRRLFFARPADFMDADGTVLELGMRVSIINEDGLEIGSGEICLFDEDSMQPIGIVSDLDSYSRRDIRWLAQDEVRAM